MTFQLPSDAEIAAQPNYRQALDEQLYQAVTRTLRGGLPVIISANNRPVMTIYPCGKIEHHADRFA